MRPLFLNWKSVAERIAGAEAVLIGFDYDGTLTPIVEKPGWALLPERTSALLKSLASRDRYYPAVISGRSLTEIRELVELPEIIYAGNHGLELTGPSLQFLHPEAIRARPVIEKLGQEIETQLKEIDGTQVEDKGLTISIHFRRVNRKDLDRTLKIIKDATRSSLRKREVNVTFGKKVIEIRPPVNWNKGNIITWLQGEISRKTGGEQVLPIYIGDDRTDEDAFRAIAEDGITIRIGKSGEKSRAQYYIEGVEEVREFISRLITL